MSASSRPPPSVWPLSAAIVGQGNSVDRRDRLGEGVGDERLGVFGEAVLGQAADVVAGAEDAAGAGDDQAAGLDASARVVGDRVEDLVVERVALVRVVDAQPRDVLGAARRDQLAAGELPFADLGS